jgi:hypothetical protein
VAAAYVLMVKKAEAPVVSVETPSVVDNTAKAVIPVSTPTPTPKTETLMENTSAPQIVAVPVNPNTYQNKKYGFEITFPETWKNPPNFGFKEQMSPDFGYVSFQPQGTNFNTLQIEVFTKDQWNKWKNKSGSHILGQNDAYVYAFSQDPNNIKDDCTGGGQFSKFEKDRCKEVPQIIKTFKLIEN